MPELLEVKNLSVSIRTTQGNVQAVRDVSLALHPGEVLALVGESGCGKSILCKTIMKILPRTAHVESGQIFANGVDITNYSEREMRKLRGKLFSMVFQDPMTSLNPTLTIGRQIGEAVLVHEPKIGRKALEKRVVELMELVGIDHARERMKLYPYHFSGGMRQRVVMAIALAGGPKILFADEPTTALDVTIQAQILDLLRKIQQKLGTATILVSHDLGVVARAADRVAVMYAGKIVEIGRAEEIYYDPRHPYTWGLMQALPAFAKERGALKVIPGMPPVLIDPIQGDAFACRNEYALGIDYEEEPPMFQITDTHFAATWLLDPRAPKIAPPAATLKEPADLKAKMPTVSVKGTGVLKSMPPAGGRPEILLDVQNLSHSFRLTRKASIKAVDDVSFQIRKGEIFGLVGESGSGKSTVARCLMNIYKPAAGKAFYHGINIFDPKQFEANKKLLETRRQLIFQDSASSLNPRMKVADIIAEPLSVARITPPRGNVRAEAEFQMHYVGLDASYLERYPSELSGGQRQRVAIARALSMEPELLVADEPIASLDVSIQAQIITLFQHLQQEHGFTFLFIAHDLAMVEYLCDRVGVMYHGKLVEIAPAGELFSNPLHGYTKALLSAIPIPDPEREQDRKLVEFEGTKLGNGYLVEVSPEHFVYQEVEGV